MTRPPMLAADHIRELTQRHNTITVITRDNGDQEYHNVPQPPLLEQLGGITGGASLSDSDAAPASFNSKPAAHLGALDALHRIEKQARGMARTLDVDDRGTTTAVLLRISGQIGDTTNATVRSWWATARLLTQHDAPPHRPHGAPCPECFETNTIRIRLDEELAACSECGAVWDRSGDPGHGSLDILAQHVRWCTDHQVTKPRHWLTDEAGFPTECVECIMFRRAYATWKNRIDTQAQNVVP